jgi:hypothetical protein
MVLGNCSNGEEFIYRHFSLQRSFCEFEVKGNSIRNAVWLRLRRVGR